jgi:hypothetical protein
MTLPFELAHNTVNNIQHGELKVSTESPVISDPLLIIDRFEYVKNFEQPDVLLPNTWIVVRIDGRGFHK